MTNNNLLDIRANVLIDKDGITIRPTANNATPINVPCVTGVVSPISLIVTPGTSIIGLPNGDITISITPGGNANETSIEVIYDRVSNTVKIPPEIVSHNPFTNV